MCRIVIAVIDILEAFHYLGFVHKIVCRKVFEAGEELDKEIFFIADISKERCFLEYGQNVGFGMESTNFIRNKKFHPCSEIPLFCPREVHIDELITSGCSIYWYRPVFNV